MVASFEYQATHRCDFSNLYGFGPYIPHINVYYCCPGCPSTAFITFQCAAFRIKSYDCYIFCLSNLCVQHPHKDVPSSLWSTAVLTVVFSLPKSKCVTQTSKICMSNPEEQAKMSSRNAAQEFMDNADASPVLNLQNVVGKPQR